MRDFCCGRILLSGCAGAPARYKLRMATLTPPSVSVAISVPAELSGLNHGVRGFSDRPVDPLSSISRRQVFMVGRTDTEFQHICPVFRRADRHRQQLSPRRYARQTVQTPRRNRDQPSASCVMSLEPIEAVKRLSRNCSASERHWTGSRAS